MNELRELMQEVNAFSEERDWDQFHSPVNLAKSISIEAAELLECYQWNDDADPDAVEEELADVLNLLPSAGCQTESGPSGDRPEENEEERTEIPGRKEQREKRQV